MSAGEKAQLDLATAYEELNDFEGARQILQELIDAGSAEALRRLAKLGARAGEPATAPRHPPAPSPQRTQPPVNTGGPWVHIDENHAGGLILDGEERRAGPRKTVDIEYWIVDGASGQLLCRDSFSSYAAAEKFIADHFADRSRWRPPVPSEEEHAQVVRLLELLEGEGERRWRYPGGPSCGLWAHLSYLLHQRTHPPELEARISAVLQGNPFEPS